LDNLDDIKRNHSDGSAGGTGAGASDASVEQAADMAVDPTVDQGRRRFSRSAIAGGAVLASLGSRAAWGQAGDVVDCMSVMTLNSFHPETGMFTSSPAGRPDHLKLDLAERIHEIGDPPDYLGSEVDGETTWRTCQDINNVDYVCLVRGNCPE
jgi:hypothetical protein